MDDLGGGNTNDLGSYSSLATFTTTSPKTSVSFVSPSLTIRASLLSLSDKSTGDVMGNVDVDYATASFYVASISVGYCSSNCRRLMYKTGFPKPSSLGGWQKRAMPPLVSPQNEWLGRICQEYSCSSVTSRLTPSRTTHVWRSSLRSSMVFHSELSCFQKVDFPKVRASAGTSGAAVLLVRPLQSNCRTAVVFRASPSFQNSREYPP